MNRQILLNEKDIPKQWYNIQADMPNPVPPPLNPASFCRKIAEIGTCKSASDDTS